MGWKSTKTLTRAKAISLIEERLENASNDELSCALEGIGYGDNGDLPYYGCNFTVVNNLDARNDLKEPNNFL